MRRFAVFTVILLTLAGISLLLGRRDGPGPGREAVASGVRGVPADSFHVAGVPDEVAEYLRAGRSWRAALRMREFLEETRSPEPEAYLLAARAEAGWGGWERVREYLEGRDWLDETASGEGWYWLARALEEDEEWAAATEAYGRYLERAPAEAGDRRLVAEMRRGLILLREGRAREGAELLRATREQAPELEPWVDVRAAESLAEAGDTAGVAAAVAGDAPLPALRARGRRALVRAFERAEDPVGARRTALALRGRAEGDSERAELSYAAGRLGLALGETAAARGELLAALAAAPGTRAALEAARLLEDVPGLDRADRLAIAGVYDRHGDDRRAAAGYRAWLESEAGGADERRDVRLRLGRALFDAGDFAAAETALAPLASASGAGAAEALLITGRAQYRRDQRTRAFETFDRLAQRFPGSTEGSEGLFLVADLTHDTGDQQRAAQLYRRVAGEFRGTDRSGLAMMRLGGIHYLARDFADAARVWDEYRSLYPRGERWLQASYWAGRSHEAVGDTAAARARYRAIRAREPISYYALRASERLGVPFWPIPVGPAPAAADTARVGEWMRGVDLLREAGLHAEAEAEVGRVVARAGDDPTVLYPLAETLIERGYTIPGIQIGQRLQRAADRPSVRLLRILYPFPYRPMIEAEARERGLDPFLVAALARQESLFTARISSPVGARGLMQIMPETGAVLARSAGIDGWDVELLYQPEINTHLGTRYLADQMRGYDGSLPSVFSAYNAGPHRVDQWRRFPEYGDEELFTERIPYRETRDYVKILTRNIALYQGLYGDGSP